MNDIIFKTILLKGDAGNNIGTIEKTATSGLVDTYTITLTDGATTNFQVTNGSNIANVQKTATAGLVDTYTITLTNGDTFNFEVVNGADGANINLAPTERGDTASRSYEVGEHLVTARDGYYYKVTEPISVGDTLAESSNIEKKFVSEEIEELFQYVSSGKSVVAGAITDKGVQTASDATFATLAQNIANIPNHNSGTYTVSDDGSYDMGEANTYRFVNVSTPNHNSGTFPVNVNGLTDMGEANTYRYVNVNTTPSATLINKTNLGHSEIKDGWVTLSGYKRYIVFVLTRYGTYPEVTGAGATQIFLEGIGVENGAGITWSTWLCTTNGDVHIYCSNRLSGYFVMGLN
jgi:hypothetical protein